MQCWYRPNLQNQGKSLYLQFSLTRVIQRGRPVELHIRNLGRISDATISIKPLTVFVGPNGTNKTWAAYAFYALAQTASRDFLADDALGKIDKLIRLRIDETVDSFVQSLSPNSRNPLSAISLNVERSSLIDKPNGAELRLNSFGLNRCLNVDRAHFQGALVTLRIPYDDLAQDRVERMTFIKHDEGGPIEVAFHAGKTLRHRRFFLADGGIEHIKGFLPEILRTLAIGVYEGVVALPAERKALSSFFDVLKPEFSKIATRPASEFVEMLQRAQLFSKHSRERMRQSQFHAIAEKFLEGDIFGGTIEFEEGKSGLSFSGKDHPPLAMQGSASLTRSLSGLDVYLKQFARPGDLLIVDEPEMNAHPDAQLKVIELLAILVNNGIRVLMTTHSPYVVDHLNVLIEGHRLSKSKLTKVLSDFALGNSQVFINPNDISAYLFQESGEVKDIFSRTDGLIDVETFSETTNRIGSLYSRIISNEK